MDEAKLLQSKNNISNWDTQQAWWFFYIPENLQVI